VRRGAAWLVTLPIALIGIEAAHAFANAAFGSPEEAGEIFASAASGAELVPVLSALALGLVLLGLGGRVAGRWWLPRGARSLALPFACLPPVAFLLLELVEALSHRGHVPADLGFEPAFLAGLALQIPFALTGYLVARLLLRLSDGVRGLIVRWRPAPPLERPRALPSPPRDDPPRRARRGGAHLGRAPPVGLLLSG
jgi:hypothetical protein